MTPRSAHENECMGITLETAKNGAGKTWYRCTRCGHTFPRRDRSAPYLLALSWARRSEG